MRNVTTTPLLALLAGYVLLAQTTTDFATQAPETLRRMNQLARPAIPQPTTRGMELPGANKIDPRLRLMLVAPAAERNQRSIALGAAADGRLPVVVVTRTMGDVAQTAAAIRARNGDVDEQFENTIWARIPRDAVTAVAGLANVDAVRVQPDQQVQQAADGDLSARGTAPVADGVRAARMQLLHQRGIDGKGVKIGILDQGFRDYTKLLKAGKVKAPRMQKAFPDGYAVENRVVHGTACAEIISAAAPGAEIYLAAFDGREGTMLKAADWLIAQGVQIISDSNGSVFEPNDDSNPASRYVDYTTEKYGVLWVVSSGNYARQHWAGWSDADEDGFIKIGADTAGILVASVTDTVHVVVRWNDWGPDPQHPSSDQDIDAYLLAETGDSKSLTKVAESTDTQNGGAAAPIEDLEYSKPGIAGKTFLVALRARHVTRRLWVDVFVIPDGELYPAVAAGSVVSPASARAALAVGAVDVLTGKLANYSSQGPTEDKRLKPEISAPTNTVSFAYADHDGRFQGTSAACPHAAAFAALLKQMNPQIKAPDLRTLAMRSVIPEGTPRPNSGYGYGHIDGGSIPDADNTIPPEAAPGKISSGLVPGEGSIAVPPEFGGSVSFSTIAALRNLAGEQHDGLSVHLVSGRDVYRPGDGMKLGLQASGDCSCLLLLRNSRGQYEVVRPEDAAFFALRRGEPFLLPRSENEMLEVTGPGGSEELMLVCTSQPINLNAAVAARPVRGLAAATYSYLIEGK